MVTIQSKSEQELSLKDKSRLLRLEWLVPGLAGLIILGMLFSSLADGELNFMGIVFKVHGKNFQEDLEKRLNSNKKGEIRPEIQTWIAYLSKLEFDTPLSKEIRRLQRSGVGPFQSYSKKIKVSWSHEIPERAAAICQQDVLYNESLIVFNHTMSSVVVVKATISLIPCGSSVIQISLNDARKLLNVRDDQELPQDLEEATVESYPDLPVPQVPVNARG